MEIKKKWKIIQEVNEKVIEKTVKLCRKKKIIIPTFEQLKNPSKIPKQIKEKLKTIGMQDINPLNLFRISWKNEPKAKGGLFNDGNYIVFPEKLTGVKAKIVGIVGRHFPTGAHKVGAAFGCIVPRLVAGTFDPSTQSAVWPSTGNYCRGGAYDCALLGCKAIAILPKGMSKERFDWLKKIGTDEIIGTPGCESNVKEIYDKCWELRKTRKEKINIFNQFEEFGNSIWHYTCTGSICEEVFHKLKKSKDCRFAGFCSSTGSAGTISAGDYLKVKFPNSKVVAGESVQCPTLLLNGFGDHRIEGIGDKHVPFIHNTRNTDCVAAIDDEQCMQILRIFNEDAGKKYLIEKAGLSKEFVASLHNVGISGICNMIMAIKTAKYFEMDEKDYIFIPLTDSMDLYSSRIKELQEEDKKKKVKYDLVEASSNFAQYLKGVSKDDYEELSYYGKKKLHNFKYFTWVEQQGKELEELNDLWNRDFWKQTFAQVEEWDKLIIDFNKKVGIDLDKL